MDAPPPTTSWSSPCRLLHWSLNLHFLVLVRVFAYFADIALLLLFFFLLVLVEHDRDTDLVVNLGILALEVRVDLRSVLVAVVRDLFGQRNKLREGIRQKRSRG